MAEGYNTVAKLAKTFVSQKRASSHSKKWLNKELTDRKNKTGPASPQDYQHEAKVLKIMIKASE